ncbi:sugar transferase [uncultured Ilyobacter sp.]|uniref:sugar transferase n=1 Tax=uncultured Ilyobacter sp. TaxID=544433 RepID=UPI0029F55D84|nr:sugar transferase [uncultured Ilyobacter sp.]
MIFFKYFLQFLIIILQFVIYYSITIALNIESKFIFYSFSVYLALNILIGTYSLKNNLIWENLKNQFQLHIEFFVVISITDFFFFYNEQILKFFFISFIFIFLNILLITSIKNFFWKYLSKKIIIIGTGDTAKHFSDLIKIHHSSMYDLLGFIQVQNEIKVPKDQVICKYEDIFDFIKTNPIDEIVVALPGIVPKKLNWRKISEELDGKVEKIKFIPDSKGIFNFNSKIQDYDGLLLLTTSNYIKSKFRNIVKRMMDIILGSVGVFILGILVLIFSRKIKKDGGPIFFKHTRIGKDLKEFKIYKFRTMYVDAEKRLQEMFKDEKVQKEYYKNFKLKNDPRITPVGEFLRKTSLDEFPQFINVLKGEMSLIGPRPIIQRELEIHYGKEIAKKIFQIKPGITGMWQSHGRSDIEDYDERIASDLYYIKNWSLWLDIVILLKTIKCVIYRKGAY